MSSRSLEGNKKKKSTIHKSGKKEKEKKFQVEKIVRDRKIYGIEREFLIKWKGWHEDYNTWETKENMKESCPDLLNDYIKVFSISPSTRLLTNFL